MVGEDIACAYWGQRRVRDSVEKLGRNRIFVWDVKENLGASRNGACTLRETVIWWKEKFGKDEEGILLGDQEDNAAKRGLVWRYILK